jgi:hypothetical protein
MSEVEYIKQVQKALKELGLYRGRIDGDFGPMSRDAVLTFQRLHGLKVDGIVGKNTWDHLFPKRPIRKDHHDDDPPSRAEIKKLPTNRCWPWQRDVEKFYGKIETIPNRLVYVEPPYPLWYAADLNQPIKRFMVHQKVAPSVTKVLTRVAKIYGQEQIRKLGLDIYAGAYNKRKMRGGSNWSMHAYGIAIDWDSANNALHMDHTKARFAADAYIPWFDAWRDEGWIGLGPLKDYDWMHVQAALV